MHLVAASWANRPWGHEVKFVLPDQLDGVHLLAKEDVLLLLYLDYRLRLTAPLKPELLAAPAYRGMEQGIEEEIGGPTLPGTNWHEQENKYRQQNNSNISIYYLNSFLPEEPHDKELKLGEWKAATLKIHNENTYDT